MTTNDWINNRIFKKRQINVMVWNPFITDQSSLYGMCSLASAPDDKLTNAVPKSKQGNLKKLLLTYLMKQAGLTNLQAVCF